jgi:hypothetical protein
MNLKDVIKSQYLAALAMLEQAVTACPEALWDDPAAENKFWQIAYHALFYTHLYLQESESHFRPWPKHRKEARSIGPQPGPAYRQEDILEYLAFCRDEVETRLAELALEGESSGFDWLPFGKLELQLYNIRHLQHHTGELYERLGTQAAVEVNWVGMKHLQ